MDESTAATSAVAANAGSGHRTARDARALLGLVIIARNEGERFRQCLKSVRGRCAQIIYVDSGSTDGSVQHAQSLNVEVLELDSRRPFTMARARNAGFHHLQTLAPHLPYVMFVDGDCLVNPAWPDAAVQYLNDHPHVAAVAGHRRERYPDASIYNRITDMEWRAAPGDADFLGGDIVARTCAIAQVNGYCEPMIAGEDPEICLRLRARGWKLMRLDLPMTLHDAAMTHFNQWLKRTLRTGYGYAHAAHLHRRTAENPWQRDLRRGWIWGIALPAAAIILAWPSGGWSLLLLGAYPLWALRIARDRRRRFSDAWPHAIRYGICCMLAKPPQACGQLLFTWHRLRNQSSRLIEYKTSPA